MNFFEYVDQWKSSCRFNVGDGWRQTQDRMLEIHVLPFIGSLALKEITPFHISKIFEAGKQKNHKANTAKQTYLLLSKIFNDAINFFEYIEKSPVRKAFHRPKADKKEARYLTPEEAVILTEYAKYHWSIQAIVIQLFVGLRVGEVMALKWKDIDFDRGLILIRSKYNRKTKKIESPKNKRESFVPIAGDIEQFLKDLKETMHPSDGDFVCAGPDAVQMMSYHSYQKAIIYLCKGAGIKRVSSHAFRHTCSVLWVRQGATTHDMQNLLNHESIASTMQYMHGDNIRLRDLANRVMKIKKTI
jgi:integrase